MTKKKPVLKNKMESGCIFIIYFSVKTSTPVKMAAHFTPHSITNDEIHQLPLFEIVVLTSTTVNVVEYICG